MADPELPELSGGLSSEEINRRIEERRNITPRIDPEAWNAAVRDPKVAAAVANAVEEGERMERERQDSINRAQAEQASPLREGVTLLGNLGKTAIKGDLGKMMCQVIGRVF